VVALVPERKQTNKPRKAQTVTSPIFLRSFHTGKLWDPGCGSATVLILLQMLLSLCYGREALIRSTTVALWQTSGYVDNMKSSLVTNTMRLKLRENF
jgi:hypothetical protein